MWRWASPAISRMPGRFRERPLPIPAISATISYGEEFESYDDTPPWDEEDEDEAEGDK